jgi:hypothetical protein
MNTPQALSAMTRLVLEMRFDSFKFTSKDVEQAARECQPLISATEGDVLAATLDVIKRTGCEVLP